MKANKEENKCNIIKYHISLLHFTPSVPFKCPFEITNYIMSQSKINNHSIISYIKNINDKEFIKITTN